MSNIARQYIHVSYTDVFNIFIVTTFTLNIFYIICYIDEQLPRHIELTVHQVAFNQEIHTSFCFSCRSYSVCASFVRRFPCALKLSWKYDRYGISVLSFSPPPSSPQKPTKSNPPVRRHTARHTEDEGELSSMLQPGDWDVTTEQQVEKRTNTARSESTQGMFSGERSTGWCVKALRVHLHQFNHLNPDRSGLRVGWRQGPDIKKKKKKGLKSLWSGSWGRWNNPAVQPCSPSAPVSARIVEKLMPLCESEERGGLCLKSSCPRNLRRPRLRSPARTHTHTQKHTCEFISINLHKSTPHLHIMYFSFLRFGATLRVVEVRLHKDSSASRSRGVFNTETLVVTCLGSSVAHSCRFLLLFCQEGQAVREMLSSIFPLCFGKTCFFFPSPPTKCPSMHGLMVFTGSAPYTPTWEKAMQVHVRPVHIRAHTHNFHSTLEKHTKKESSCWFRMRKRMLKCSIYM